MAAWGSLATASFLLAGCMSSPTYGTGVSANTQLMTDMSNIIQIGPKQKPKIAYQPRPELVKPGAPEQAATLPEPQQRLARADNPDWPESPEQRRARIRAEATANQNNPFYEPEVASDGDETPPIRSARVGTSPRAIDTGRIDTDVVASNARRNEFKKRLAEQQQGSPTTRKYLSEPPLAYRQPADTAPTDDIGEDEWKKEKRLKAEARKKSGKSGGWFDWLPGT